MLYLILAVALFQGAASEGFDRLSELHVLRGTAFPGSERNVAYVAVLFGALYGVSLLLSIGATELVKRTVDIETQRVLTRALSVLNALLIAAVVGFALTDGFVLAVILLWTAGVMREVQAPLSRAWINHDLDPRARATINSIGGQADALGQIAGGPGIGALALGGSVRAALVASGLLLAPAQALYARALRRHMVDPPEAGSASDGSTRSR